MFYIKDIVFILAGDLQNDYNWSHLSKALEKLIIAKLGGPIQGATLNIDFTIHSAAFISISDFMSQNSTIEQRKGRGSNGDAREYKTIQDHPSRKFLSQ